jgi:tetratricopeptide (TPR) repeat protein
MAAGIAAAVSPGLGDVAARSEFGPVPLLLLRSVLAFLLVLPWCVAALGSSPAIKEGTKGGLPHPSRVALCVGLGLAVLPCGMYAQAVTAARTREAADLIKQGRLFRAEGVVTGLCELGSERLVGDRSPAQARQWLADSLRGLRGDAEEPLPASASPDARLERAALLVKLERLDEAAAVLKPVVPGNDAATLMLAAVYSNQRRWAESDALYAATLERFLSQARTDRAARDKCRAAFDGLAENARQGRRPADAEAALNRGLRELPADAAHYHFLLGRHYQDAGRFGLALDHLRTAARLDPAGVGKPADALIRQIRTATPGCLAGWSH